ncbi:TetR family transcriptional regulator C-terminal domain-containing protein [Parasphingorhabdus halotolerans]|uniref:LmrA/YxaF family transcription factor n=1 Tax=Parasphingorhabdus halotolerans TaxID=2725558 RepID=UPI001FE84F48|nr:hypothetical protein [Parasphingorhabdus halotolerans]
MMQEHLEASSGSDQFVTAVADTYAIWMETSDFSSGCPIATTMLECAPHSPEIRAAGLVAIDRWITIVADAFKKNGNDSLDAASKGEAFIAGIQGALILSRIRKNVGPLDKLAESFRNHGIG